MFGGTAPCPLRLGGSPQEGWSPEQLLRMAADVVAARRMSPFAVFTVVRNGTTVSPVLESQISQVDFGSVTLSGDHPSFVITATFPAAVDDVPIVLRGVKMSPSFYTNPFARATVLNNSSIQIDLSSQTGSFKATISAFADFGPANEPGDYGAFRNKIAAAEEPIPHAYSWYQELDSALGSAYSGKSSGSVHARKIAVARALSGVLRSDERMRCQSTPQSSTVRLGNWARIVEVPRPDGDKDWKLRERVSAFYAARNGGTIGDLERAIQSVIGRYFVGIQAIVENDWGQSEWPSAWDTGGGAWASNNCRLIIKVNPAERPNDPEWSRLMNVDLYALMDRLLHAAAGFSWAVDTTDGFNLGVDRLGIDGL